MIVFIMCEKAQFVYAEAHLFKMSFLYWHRRKRIEAFHLSLITTLSLEVSDFYSLIRSDYNSAFPLFCERKNGQSVDVTVYWGSKADCC